jgi:hypothetical protein
MTIQSNARTAQPTTSWWRGQIFTAALLLIIVALAVWALLTGIGAAAWRGAADARP